jgi:acyl carrier protein
MHLSHLSTRPIDARIKEAVRELLLGACVEGLALVAMDPAEVSDDFDLREAGVVDSLGFLELVTILEDELGIELDFEDMEPEQLTTVGPLVTFVARQVRVQIEHGVA